jgi:hypothetical protein
MSDEQRDFTSVDQLPDNPAAMPPPYWRSGGSGLQLHDATDRLIEAFHELVDVTPRVKTRAEQFRQDSRSAEATDEYSKEIRQIYDEAWRLENQITLRSELVILMAAIYAEELINRFAVYNIPKDLVETLEKLSPAEKLLASASHLGHAQVRSNAAYAAIAELLKWRNAYAHGHCVDRPTKSLRHNHLITPEGYIDLPQTIAAVSRHLLNFERVVQYLATISVNSYTKSVDNDHALRAARKYIDRFQVSGSPVLYDVAIVVSAGA